MIIAPGMLIDRFEVVRLLGEGGLARVYLVRHKKLKSLHALKALHVSSDKSLKRFLLEGQVQARIRHPNVVAVTDVVELGDQVGLVMEYVEGTTLADVLGDGRPLPADDVATIFRELCEGVMAAHRQGVLHRDLKPGNVLLAVTERGVLAKITDFGIAKVAREVSGATLTEVGTMIGTPGYMAPEQLTDASTCDMRADVFSLGCILYEMLVGHAPYLRDERMATFNATMAGEHIPAAQLEPRVTAQLDAVIERAIHPSPAVRHPSVSELLAEAIPALASLPRAAPQTIVAPDAAGPATGSYTTSATEISAQTPRMMRAWTHDVPVAGATAGRAALLPPSPTRASTSRKSGAILDFRRRSRWGAVDVIAPVILLLTCGAAVAWSVDDAAADVRSEVGAVRSMCARLDAPFQVEDGAVARAWARAGDRAPIIEQAERFRASTTPTERTSAGHGLVRTLRADVGHQMQAATTPDARTALAQTMHDLDTIDGEISGVERGIAGAEARHGGALARLAEGVGWLGPADDVGAPALVPLPELAALSAAPPVVATRPGRRER